MSTPVHVVQLSFDKDVFSKDAPQDSQSRQLAYARYINEKYPGATLTNIILVNESSYKRKTIENLDLVPVCYHRLRHIYSLFKYLSAYHKQHPITVMTTQDFHGIFWAGLAFSRVYKVPVVGQHHCDLSSRFSRETNFTKPYGNFYQFISLFLARFFNGLRVVNTAAKEFLIKQGCKNRIEVLPVPSETFVLDRKTEKNQDRDQNILKVMFAGRFVEFKNLECWLRTAAEALEKHPDMEFYLIGDGQERAKLEELSKELGLEGKITFTGALNPQELARWYVRCDVFMLTSLYEGFGRVIVESMHYGMVPVCTNVSGPQDIIEQGENGFLAEPDPDALSECLVELAKNPRTLTAMSKNAQSTANIMYSPDKLRKDWLDFLLSYVHQSKKQNILNDNF